MELNASRTFFTRLIFALGVACLAVDLIAKHHIGSILWLAMSAAFLAFLILTDFTVLPNAKSPFCQTLTPEEFRLFRAYHVSLLYPAAADSYSAALNASGMISVVFGVMAFVDRGFITGGLLIAMFLVCAAYQLRISPRNMNAKAAAKGESVAMWRTRIMISVEEKLRAARKKAD
jgi:hypothetical protein